MKLRHIEKRFRCAVPMSLALMMMTATAAKAETWTLQQCIDYAKEHSITLKKLQVSEQEAQSTLLQSKAALLPTLSASTSQNVTNRPWSNSISNVMTDGAGNMTLSSSQSSTNYSGNYGLNLSYTLWNGGRRTRQIEQNQLSLEKAGLSTQEQENALKEKIVTLYVQTLYAQEGITVNENTLKVAQAQRDRAAKMVQLGQLAKADLAQLEAQVAKDQYNVVEAQTSVARNKLQLKQLLELPSDTDFDIASFTVSDAQAMDIIPNASEVYQTALTNRPEIRGSQLSIDIADKQIAIAKTGKLPTVSASAGIGTSNMTGSGIGFFTQLKNNWSNSAGINVQVPIFSQRQNKTAVEKAELQRQTAQLDLEDKQKTLRNTIDGYWLDATNAQAQFKYAKANVESMQASFDLLSEQFNVGLKNLVELMDGKNNLLNAQQTKLQSKYTFILNEQLLKYYGGEEFKL